MLENEDYASDTSDEDYRPSDGEAVSEEEGSGEEEDFTKITSENAEQLPKNEKKRKRKCLQSKETARKRKGGIKLDDESPVTETVGDDYTKQLSEEILKEKEEKKKVDEKKRADNLWSSFMSEVGSPGNVASSSTPVNKATSRPSTATSIPSPSLACTSKPHEHEVKVSSSVSNETVSSTPVVTSPPNGDVTITKDYDFAGETVRVTKVVKANSKEALDRAKQLGAPAESTSLTPRSRRGAGGLGSILGRINKKNKISTLDKSKLDWDSFKKEEGIEEELTTHNRGKEGYIERQKFLERTDYAQFEKERDMRLLSSKK